MTMTDTGLTPRERMESALVELDRLEQVLVEKGAAKTDEDVKAADHQAAEVQRLWSTLGARELLADQSRIVDGRSFEDLASASGIIDPTPGMTFGEAFTKSPAYLEQMEKNLRSDGSFVEHIGKSRSVDFGVALKGIIEGKTLVTGASQTSGGAFIVNERLPGVADVAPMRMPTVIGLCTRVPLSGDTMEWVEITSKTNAAAAVAEATSLADGIKPESAMATTERQQAVQSIAHWIPITRRAAADAPQLRTYIDTFLLQGLAARVEDQLINGTGASPQLRGILNATTAWSIQTLDVSVAAVTRLDAAAIAAANIYSTLEGAYEPTAILVHPLDWFSVNFALAREGVGTGQYLGGGPFAGGAARNLWGTQVVISKAVPQGTQLIGDFRQALVGDREQASMYMTDSHASTFVSNILTILAELRLAFALRVPQAFVSIVA
jgi:HK97 family phage major capsid protein